MLSSKPRIQHKTAPQYLEPFRDLVAVGMHVHFELVNAAYYIHFLMALLVFVAIDLKFWW
jgi:hypothetical protein